MKNQSEKVSQMPPGTGTAKKLAPGGYICEIFGATIEPTDWGKMLKIKFDIAEGEFKGYFQNKFEAPFNTSNKWPFAGTKRFRLYDEENPEEASEMLLKFTNALVASNNNFTDDDSYWNLIDTMPGRALAHKQIGIVFREEEYLSSYSNQIEITTKPYYFCSADTVRNGVQIPSIKKYKEDRAITSRHRRNSVQETVAQAKPAQTLWGDVPADFSGVEEDIPF